MFRGALLVVFLIAPVFAQQLGPAPRMPEGEELERLHKYFAERRTYSQPVVSPPASWVDTTSRSAVQNFYNSGLLPYIDVASGWTGSIPSDIPGTTSAAYQNAVLARINWFRSMAGVPPVASLDAGEGAEDQQAALMMSVNNQLSHSPPSTWTDYTAGGATAASHSNLCLGFDLIYDPGCIQLGYIEDIGANNFEVGHRRWILYPQTQVMATGDVTPTTNYSHANALWVFDANLNGTRPATRDTYVAWPPQGYVPYPVVYPRWSFSYPGADFSAATVTMNNGSAVPVRLETLATGYGENTIVWVPNGLSTVSLYSWPKPASDTTYNVTISNVSINGTPQSFSYSVTIFDPAPPPVAITFNSNISGPVIYIDSVSTSLPVTLNWTPGDQHTISKAVYTPGNASLWLFQNWSDGGGDAHTITVPDFATTYTANYVLEYFLTLSPGANGTIAASPTSATGYYANGSTVSITALPNAGYVFTGFSGGALSGLANPQNLTMTSAATVAASFSTGHAPASINITAGNNQNATVAKLFGTPLQVVVKDSGQAAIAGVAVTFVAPASGAGGAFALGATVTVTTNAQGIAMAPAFTANLNAGTYVVSAGSGATSTSFTLTNNPVNGRPGVFQNGNWALDLNGNGQWDGVPADAFYNFTAGAGDIAVYGDWNGDGRTKIGVYHQGFWLLDYNGNGVWDGPSIDRFIALGGPGYLPVVGDWNGDGRTKTGFYYNGFWALDYNGNGAWDGTAGGDRFIALSLHSGETTVVGDWNGDGRAKVGVFYNGQWALDDNGNGMWDAGDKLYTFSTGGAGEVPVLGDWSGSHTTKIGVYYQGFWLLDYNGNGAWDGSGTDRFIALGGNGYTPVVGDWNGDGKAKVGFYVNGFWGLDFNGNGTWDGPSGGDRFVALGGTGQQLVVGKW